MSINLQKLDFWIENEQNVLFIGKHGVGKTAMVKDAFERHSLRYKYFSASTMDPWVDFIGVPKEKKLGLKSDQISLVKDLIVLDKAIAVEWMINNWNMTMDSANRVVDHLLKDSNVSYLDLIRPESFATGDVQALFFDEFNRSPKKVRNAVMELIQFKSINGYRFPRLKLVWAAINPEDDELSSYDVEKIDPAQKDRFHVVVSIPYKPNVEWFRTRYGSKAADAAIQWWNELEDNSEVSPRRLQYALDLYLKKGDMRDVLPTSSNVSKLVNVLSTGPILEKLEQLASSGDKESARSFLSNENNFASAIKYISKSDKLLEYFLPLCPKEKISFLLSKNEAASRFIISNHDKHEVFDQVMKEVLAAGTNMSLVKKIRKYATESKFVFEEEPSSEQIEEFFNVSLSGNDASWTLFVKKIRSLESSTIKKERVPLFREMVANIPKDLSSSDVATCLQLLAKLDVTPSEVSEGNDTSQTDRSIWSYFVPIVNHLIREGVKNKTLGDPQSNVVWLSNQMPLKDFQAKNVSCLSSIYASIKLAGLEGKVIKSQSQLGDLA